MVNKVSKFIHRTVKEHVNYLIGLTGIILFVFFYCVALNTAGLIQSLLIDLSAGSLIIAITILIVDSIKQRHLALNVQSSAVRGVSKIQMANFSIVNMLGDHHFHDLDKHQSQLLEKISKSLKNKSKHPKSYIEEYIDRLLELDNDSLLKNMDKEQVTKLQKYFINLEQICINVMETYSFAFSNKSKEAIIDLQEIANTTLMGLQDKHFSNKSDQNITSQLVSIYLDRFRNFQKLKKY